jgi:hypothetical protein
LKFYLHNFASLKKKHSFKREAGTITGDVLINDFVTLPVGEESKEKIDPLSAPTEVYRLLPRHSVLSAVAARAMCLVAASAWRI